MLDHIAGPTDSEISSILLNSYKKKGVDFKLSAKVTEITDSEVLFETSEGKQSVSADKVLASIGRRPFTEGLGLEKSALKLCEVE